MATKNTKRHENKYSPLLVTFCVLCGHLSLAEPGSLNDMHDIVMPEPVSAWPPAPGVWVLLMVILFIAAALFLRWLKTYRANAYRRYALNELTEVTSSADIGEILRRVSIQARGRETITALQGEVWFQWLETEGGFPMPEAARLALAGIYSNTNADSTELQAFAERWIREHAC